LASGLCSVRCCVRGQPLLPSTTGRHGGPTKQRSLPMNHHLPTGAQMTRAFGLTVGAAALLFITTVLARAEDGDARKILKAMTDYMAGQRNLSATYDTDIEVITPDLQKIQFT